MAYAPTTWVNDSPPPLSAANLNKLTNEIEAQAAVEGIAHTLPNWQNNAEPALTDEVPLNEMERVVALIASARSLSYTETVWSDGWTPPRNAANFNKLEQQVQENAGEPGDPGDPEGPISITEGGTYTGHWVAGGGAHAVNFDTDEPVTIVDSIITQTGSADLIRGAGYVLKNLTLERCFLNGGVGRVFDAIGIEQLTVRNCTFDKTSGMKFSECSGADILVTRNKHRNVQGPDLGGAALSQFSQFAVVSGTVEVSWNEIVNDPELSHSEDLLSIYKSSGFHVHNNIYYGQWTVGNQSSSSQNGITVEEGEGGPPPSSDILIEQNQVVAGMAIGVFAGDNVSVLNNRIVRSGYYPDGVTKVKIGYSGLDIQNGAGVNNHAHGNLVGYVSGEIHGSTRTDWQVLPAHCNPLNTHYPGTVTVASEEAEFDLWLQKLIDNGITVGA